MIYAPHDGAQEEFLSRDEFEVLGGGSCGGGKSFCLILAMLRDIENPNYHGLIIRRTFPQLQEIIDRCHELYPHLGGIYRSGEKRWTFPSGAKIDLGHMQHEDDKYQYLGKEYHRLAYDELTMFSETQYTYMFSRMRTTDPDIKPQIISTTNPGGVGHYFVKERFITNTEPLRTYLDPRTGLSRVFVPMTIEDNPSLLDNDPDYLVRLEALPELERKRLRHGIWDAFEGQVFTELSQSIHGCEDFDIPPEWERYCVLDWGYARPFSVGWYAVDYDGVIYRYREWYGCKREENDDGEGDNVGLKMQAWEVAKGILEREAGEKIRRRVADGSIFDPRPQSRKRESRGPTIHDDMANEGLHFLKADRDRAQGKLQMHKRLKLDQEIDTETGEIISETPQIQIFNSCKGFWRTVPQMREDPKDPEKLDTDQEDHIADELRYMCMARPIKPKKTFRVPPGSFQAERAKMIRAKKYARRHSISVGEAYRRIR